MHAICPFFVLPRPPLVSCALRLMPFIWRSPCPPSLPPVASHRCTFPPLHELRARPLSLSTPPACSVVIAGKSTRFLSPPTDSRAWLPLERCILLYLPRISPGGPDASSAHCVSSAFLLCPIFVFLPFSPSLFLLSPSLPPYDSRESRVLPPGLRACLESVRRPMCQRYGSSSGSTISVFY